MVHIIARAWSVINQWSLITSCSARLATVPAVRTIDQMPRQLQRGERACPIKKR